jgi:pSer/pThr/pTyr-binding forkhead associated (FHA) protein
MKMVFFFRGIGRTKAIHFMKNTTSPHGRKSQRGAGEDTPKVESPVRPRQTQTDTLAGSISGSYIGNAVSHENGTLRLDFAEGDGHLVVAVDKELFLGRDSNSSDENNVDLTPYAASKKGVSRLHARLHRTTTIIYITDLNSRNGTFLNGERLSPHQARILRDGDEIHLGQLAFHVQLR